MVIATYVGLQFIVKRKDYGETLLAAEGEKGSAEDPIVYYVGPGLTVF